MTAPTPSRPRTAERRGFTMLEAVITLVVAGLVMSAIAMLSGTLMHTVTRTGNRVAAEIAADGFAGAVRTAPYVACATPASAAYQPAALAFDTGSETVAVDEVTYWDGTSSAPFVFTPVCTSDTGLQRIVVRAEPADAATPPVRAVVIKRSS